MDESRDPNSSSMTGHGQNSRSNEEDEKQLWISLFATFLIYYKMTSTSKMPVVVSSVISHLSGRFNLPLLSTLLDSFATICGDGIQFHYQSKESYMRRLNPNSLQFETIKSELPHGCKIVKVLSKEIDGNIDESCDVDIYNEFDDNDDNDEDDDSKDDHTGTCYSNENSINDTEKTLHNKELKKKKKKRGRKLGKIRCKKQNSFDTAMYIKLFQRCIENFSASGAIFPKMYSEDVNVDNSILSLSPHKAPSTPTKLSFLFSGDKNESEKITADNFIEKFIDECPEAKDCVVCTHNIPARTASLTEFSSSHFHHSICKYLKSKGINQLFYHQSIGMRHLMEDGKNIILTTSTSSGKSLVYLLPILQSCISSTDSTALMIFPTKALAQDQLKYLQEMFSSICTGADSSMCPVSVGTYDGDTDFKIRESVRKNNRVILTNPDMLHCSILPSHSRWAQFLSNLKYIVVDEAHYYKAAFGIHSSFIFRRLRRLLFHYGSNAKFILCSATVQNPLEITMNLTGIPSETIEVISEDGSPSIAKKITLFNPLVLGPLIQSPISPLPVKGFRGEGMIIPQKSSAFSGDCPYKACVLILKRLLKDKIRTVAFVKSRQTGESLFEQLLETLSPDFHNKVACYRAGYSPSERRDIEKKIKSGELIITISTNALELGVDIGLLECTVHLGFPGSISSIYQQIGRAGRLNGNKCETNDKALSIFIALDTPLEQHFMNNPQQFFERKHEAVHLNPENEEIMAKHIVLALKEEPFEYRDVSVDFFSSTVLDGNTMREEDVNIRSSIVRCANVWFGSKSSVVIDSLIKNSQIFVVKHPTSRSLGIPLLGVSPLSYPSQENEIVNIRAADNRRVSVVDITTMETIETLELSSALMELYEGSVYLHRAKSYVCLEFDPSKLVRYVKGKGKLSYFTTHKGHLAVKIDGLISLRTIRYGDSDIYEDNDRINMANETRCTETTNLERESKLRVGKVSISKTIYGYEIRSKKNAVVLDTKEVHQEPYTYETKAIWSEIPTSVQEAYYLAKSRSTEKFEVPNGGSITHLKKGKMGRRGVEVYAGEYDRGALHSIEHVLCSLAPLVVTCDPRDLGCQCTRREGDVNRYYLLLFETSRGGLGIVDKLADRWMNLLKSAYEIISKCGCKDGCLSCIHCPSCGQYNHGLDKAGAILVLSKLLGLELRVCK